MLVRVIHPQAEEEEGTLDPGILRDWLSYAWRAVRRRLPTILAIAMLVGAAAAFAWWATPDRYHVEARVLAQRPDVVSVLSVGRAPAADAVAVTRSVSDIVERRDNLVALVGQAGLVEHRRANPAPVDRLKSRLGLGYTLGDEQLKEVLVSELESSLSAQARDGTVAIELTWDDPEMAYRLLEAALQNFLETRHVNEMAILGDSISLLEQRLTEAERGLELAMQDVRSLPPSRRRTASVPSETRRGPTSLELVRMLAAIAEKRRAVEDLVSFQNRRTAELQTRLMEQKAIYADSHPAVANVRRSLEAVAAESPQLAALRRELEADQAQYLANGGSPYDLGEGGPVAEPAPSASAAILDALQEPARDPKEEYVRSRMATALARYYNVSDRLETLRLQQDAARASIKYRYLVVRPPLRPGRPENATLKEMILVGGALGGLLVGVLVALGLELGGGRIGQAWQIERALGLPVLAEIRARAPHRERERPVGLREQERPI
jgi:uncharacterized protein involved in exopolysaccharide biosynthesis